MKMATTLKNGTLPVSSLSAFSYIPPKRSDPKELTYFNSKTKDVEVSTYDCLFKRPDSYNQKLHRDDREHAKSRGLNLNNEEISRPVPVLSSSEYGRHLSIAVDKPDRKCVRVGLVRSEFYRRNGFEHSVEEGYGSVKPA